MITYDYQKLEDSASMNLQASQSQKVVLVIDDEAPVRQAVTDILEMEAIEVVTAVNGTEGIRIYQQQQDKIKVVLLDLSMPGLSGEETLHELGKINPDVHVILSSGYGQSDVLDRIGHRENVDFLQKPYNLDQLLQEVFKHLGNDAGRKN